MNSVVSHGSKTARIVSFLSKYYLWIALILVLQAVLFRVYYHPAARFLAGDEQRYWWGAQRILSGKSFEQDLFWPPLYTHFVTLAHGSILAIQIVQLIMLTITALIVRDIGKRLFGSRQAGTIACLGMLLYPSLAAYSHYIWPEVLHLLLFMTALWIMACHTRYWVLLPLAGFFLGLALLTKSILGPFLPVLLLPLVASGRPWQRIARPLIVVIAILATITPTLMDNKERHGKMVVADSAVFNLWVGLNDSTLRNFEDNLVWREYIRFQRSASTHTERNEILKKKIVSLVQRRGLVDVISDQIERQYFRLFDKDSFLTDQLPGGLLYLPDKESGYRGSRSVMTEGLRLTSYIIYGLVLVLAVIGIAACPLLSRKWLIVILAFIGYNLLVFLVLHVKTRYRVQLLPFFFLYAGYTMSWLLKKLGIGAFEPVPWRTFGYFGWILTGFGVIVIVFLAFGRSFLA